MKRNILKITTFLLSISAALIVLTGPSVAHSPIQDSATTIKPDEKTVDQVFKNIKVLNGMPQSKLYPTMRFMAASLGLQCGSCHVIPGVAEASGTVGPPLQGFGSRIYIAGLLVNTPENLVHWVTKPQEIDAGTAMPDLGVSERQAHDIAAYLYTLQ